MKLAAYVSIVVMFLATQCIWAEVPLKISFQGLLTDTQDKLVPDGDYSLTFRIYDNEMSTSELWSDDRGRR